MQNYAIKLASHTKKQLDAELPLIAGGDVGIALWVYEKFDKQKVFSRTNTISYDAGKQYEAKSKDDMLREEIKINRNLQDPKVFYLSSSHDDCAKDHINYQGRMYIDEAWKSLITDKETKIKIRDYVNRHNIKTYQWVIGKPVWFVTRPNCRHYFKAIKTEEVLTTKVGTITKNHKLHSSVGKEITRTISHPTNKAWYQKQNVEDIIRKYEERLEYHKALYDANRKNQLVKRAIEKDRLLIKKWKDYLQNYFS